MEKFSIADLENFDEGAARGGGHGAERRFLCPLCGIGKPRDSAHRSLCANTQNGAWNCKRCQATGKLTDFWTERPKLNPGEAARQRRRQLSALPDETLSGVKREVEGSPENKIESMSENAETWRQQLQGAGAIDATLAETYLAKRGIAVEVARDSGVLFAPGFYGAPAAIFPLCNRSGEMVAASGRYFSEKAKPKTRIAGAKRDALFATRGALTSPSAPAIILTEAPIDALSLATAGYSAVALCGTSAPSWIHLACGLKRVLLAFDADKAGDDAAMALESRLTPFGARCERLRPEGAKDWNEVLQERTAAFLADWLAWHVLLEEEGRDKYT